MGDVTYRANLKTASFPFLSELFGRSIIVKQQDQNYVGGLATKETLDSAIGVPQIYYCENVVPTDNGYKSVGFDTFVAEGADTNFAQVVQIHDSTGNTGDIAVTSDGDLYRRHYGATAWTAVGTPPVAGTIAGKRMTVGYVSGTSYIYFENVDCYTYSFGTGNMTNTPLTGGPAAADILGVVANRGYLIAYTVDGVFWSSTIDPTDFASSLSTGAGGGQLEGARGQIVTVESVYGGMVVFTVNNAVAGIASDNTRYPFNFIEITGCGGLLDANFVSYDANTAMLYAYTTAGLQQVGLKQAIVWAPEVTDFLSGSLFEDFNSGTNTLSLTDLAGANIQKRLSLIANRYLIISYGATSLTHALYFDSAYKQWGRLKVTHTDCFEIARSGVEVPKKSIAFLTAAGGVKILNTDVNSASSSGVMILGKFQYVRSRLLQLQRVEFENVNVGDTFSLLDLPAADGKNFGNALVGYLAQSAGKFREYLFHNTALNHSLLLKGAFNAVSLVLTFNVHGAR